MSETTQDIKQNQQAAGSIHDSIKDHMWFSGFGLIVGLLLAVVLVNFGPEFIQASPFLATVSIGLVFFLVGGMLAGLKALLPADYSE